MLKAPPLLRITTVRPGRAATVSLPSGFIATANAGTRVGLQVIASMLWVCASNGRPTQSTTSSRASAACHRQGPPQRSRDQNWDRTRNQTEVMVCSA